MKFIYQVKMINGEISYVGSTKNLKNREKQHQSYNADVDCLELLEKVDDFNCKERELFWINKKIFDGCPLKNRENKNRDGSWKHNKPSEGKINITLNCEVEPIIFNQFKASVTLQDLKIKNWLEQKIIDESNKMINN